MTRPCRGGGGPKQCFNRQQEVRSTVNRWRMVVNGGRLLRGKTNRSMENRSHRGEIDGGVSEWGNPNWGGSRRWSVTLDLDHVCDGMWLSIRMMGSAEFVFRKYSSDQDLDIMIRGVHSMEQRHDRLWVYRVGTWNQGSGYHADLRKMIVSAKSTTVILMA